MLGDHLEACHPENLWGKRSSFTELKPQLQHCSFQLNLPSLMTVMVQLTPRYSSCEGPEILHFQQPPGVSLLLVLNHTWSIIGCSWDSQPGLHQRYPERLKFPVPSLHQSPANAELLRSRCSLGIQPRVKKSTLSSGRERAWRMRHLMEGGAPGRRTQAQQEPSQLRAQA